MTIESQLQKFSLGALVTLFEIDLSLQGGPIVRFCPSSENGNTVRFNNRSYTPAVVTASGFEQTTSGSLPRPTFELGNTSRDGTQLILIWGQDLIGTMFTRIRTFDAFLDNGSDPDPNAKFPDDTYRINRKVSQTKDKVTWELAAPLDQQEKRIPARQALKDTCDQRYRIYNTSNGDFDYSRATCPYVGNTYFNTVGVRQTRPEDDNCGKKLSDCRLRFGVFASLPMRAFPGIGNYRAR